MSSFEKRPLGDPLQQFRQWFSQAKRNPQLDLPEAMCLSTVNKQGFPSARMVLLKDFTRKGFSFFTNIHSPKAQELIARPHAALTFYWRPLHRQVRVEGKVVRLPKSIANAYFATRARDSQIGSWASKQSQPLESRADLLKQFESWSEKFKGKKVPAPPHWQGFCVVPSRIEFWQERPNRLHDRWIFVRGRNGRWGLTRLNP